MLELWRPRPVAPCWCRRREWCCASAPLDFLSIVIPGRCAASNPESILPFTSRFRVHAARAPERRLRGNPDPLDFPMQLYTGIRLDSLTHGFAEHFNIMAGGVSSVDQEVAVHFRHLRAADAQ